MKQSLPAEDIAWTGERLITTKAGEPINLWS